MIMTVLLTTLNAKYIHINLAIRLLYDLNKTHEGLEMKEFTIKEDRDAIAAECSRFELVAFSCYIWNIAQTLDVCHRIKILNPDTKILLGGPEVSYEWEPVIALPCVDFIITGEGEVPFTRFLQDYPNVDGVPSLVRKLDGDMHYNPDVQGFELQNYSDLQPYLFDPTDELRNKVLYIETSRGCPYKCEFCLASLDNKVRYLPMDTIKTMLLYLMQHGRTIKFLDRTFNVKKAFTIEIFEFILANYKEGTVFQFEITADIIHPDIVAFIHERVPKGLFRFEIGIQTLNQTANKEMQRKQNFDKTKAMVLALRDKIEMHLDLIVGLPYDYWADIKYSINEVFKLYPPELQLGFLKLLKGTPVREKEEKHGLVFDKLPPYQIIESKYLSREELDKIERLEHALEIYWNKKRAENTLRYVSEQHDIFEFLLHLGIYFGTRRAYHQYILRDVYEILLDFAAQFMPDNRILRQMIFIDYYQYPKVRPQPLDGAELDKVLLNQQIESGRLNKKGFRYVALPLDFDYAIWQNEQRVSPKSDTLWLRYDGANKPTVIENLLALAAE